MSISSSISFRADSDSNYAIDGRGSFEKTNKSNHRPQYRRSGTAPGSVNGIHRRRTSRWTWGHGRGARMQNARAFASCIAAAFLAACACTASAGTIRLGSGTGAPTMEMVGVGNPGNAVNPLAPTAVSNNGGGSVSNVFEIGKYEVTNTQYVQFLNSVAKADPNNLYNASMQIARSGTSGNYSYAPNSGNASKPAAFVSFGDTFRFANWLQNGTPTGAQGPTTTENGTYNMALSQPTRNPSASFWIPSVSEWYKAAYYSPTLSGTGGYYNFPTSSNSLTASTAPGTPPAANFSSVVGASVNVGSYTGSFSPYGAFDMAGNVAERLDTLTGSTYFAMQGGYSGANGSNNATNSGVIASASLNGENATTGFRIAAVPEPSTVVLAGMAVASGMVGWLRKKRVASRRCLA